MAFNIRNGTVVFESVVPSSSGGGGGNYWPYDTLLPTSPYGGIGFTSAEPFVIYSSAIPVVSFSHESGNAKIHASSPLKLTSTGTTTIIPDTGSISLAKPGTLTEFNGPICAVDQLLTQSTTLSVYTLGASYLIDNAQSQTIILPDDGLTTGVELKLYTSNANGHNIVYPGPTGTVNYPLKQHEVIKLVATTPNTWVRMSSSRTAFDGFTDGMYTSPTLSVDSFGRIYGISGSSIVQATATSSFTIPDGTGIYLWDVPGTTASLSLTLPTNAVKIYFNQPITSLTINGSAGSVVLSGLTPTSASVGDTLSYLYITAYHLREML